MKEDAQRMHRTSRNEPGFYNFLALDRARLDAPEVIEGMAGALMSEDAASGSRTWVIEIPAGWRAATDARAASLELFVLRGDLSLNGQRVGASGYVHIPQLAGGGELASETGALALAFWNPFTPAFPAPFTRNRVVAPWSEPWVNSVPGSHGIMHKSLRTPDPTALPGEGAFDGGPGGYLRLQFIEPHMIARDEHVHHECFEEIILLAGDCFLVNEGQMAVGSVAVHPQEWYHAPFASRSGAVILVQTDAPMGYPWPSRPYPNADTLLAAYLDGSPWDTPADHVAWADHPIASMQDQSAEWKSWRSGPGTLWGGDENDRAASFPKRSLPSSSPRG